MNSNGADLQSNLLDKPIVGFNKTAYQREYMRRRRAKERAPSPSGSQQMDAHVKVWFAALGPIPRLEHKSFVRRCLIAASRH